MRAVRAVPAVAFMVALAIAYGIAVTGCARKQDAQPAQAPAAPESTSAAGIEVQPATVEQIQEAIRAPGAKAVLVNVWATWCAPCREEFPDLMRVRKDSREWGLRMVLISADADTALPEVKRFLEAEGVGFLTYLKQGADMPFINGLDSLWSGALPATLLYDGSGRKLWFHEGKTSYDTLKTRIDAALARPPSRTP